MEKIKHITFTLLFLNISEPKLVLKCRLKFPV